jgi:hypothetical protein
MTLYYPLRIVGESTFVHILDRSGRAIAGGLIREDAEEIVNALNSQPSSLGYERAITKDWDLHNSRRHELIEAKRSRSLSDTEAEELRELQWLAGIKRELQTGPTPIEVEVIGKRKSKKLQVEEALRRSDLTGTLAERDDVEYGPHDCLPRGEHVARMKGGDAK